MTVMTQRRLTCKSDTISFKSLGSRRYDALNHDDKEKHHVQI